jgi:hypothetical protein
MKTAANPSVKQLTINFTNVIKSTNAYVQNASSYLINYQCFHRFVIILGVALQEYKEYNNLHIEYLEPLNIIINVQNIGYFNLHTVTIHSILINVVMLPTVVTTLIDTLVINNVMKHISTYICIC